MRMLRKVQWRIRDMMICKGWCLRSWGRHWGRHLGRHKKRCGRHWGGIGWDVGWTLVGDSGKTLLEPTIASIEALVRATSDITIRRTPELPDVSKELQSRFTVPSQTCLVSLPWWMNSSGSCKLEFVYNATGEFSVCMYVCMYAEAGRDGGAKPRFHW